LTRKRVCFSLSLTIVILAASSMNWFVTPAKASVRIPLVLVAEPDGFWKGQKESYWSESGFLSELGKVGYNEDNLFLFTPEDPYQDLSDGAGVLCSFLREIRDKTGSEQIDVISYGVSGLVLRYAVDTGQIEDGFIRNLIMLDTPNRGSFLASFVKSLYEIVKHEVLLEKETRAKRFLPFGQVRLSSGEDPRMVLENESILFGLGSSSSGRSNETLWLADRATRVYEPLYAQYVKERFFTLPYVPLDSPKETFFGWIFRTQPMLWENCISQGITPPLKPVNVEKGILPKPGQDFTAAYYEILAMGIAKNQYVVKTYSKRNLMETLLGEPFIPSNWKEMLMHYWKKVLFYYVRNGLVTLKAKLQKVLVDNLVKEIGYVDNPESPFLRRLVEENVVINLGTGTKSQFWQVPANYYLSHLNELSMERSIFRKSRYVSVSGKVSNFWSIVWPQIGPNNWFCEVDSAVAPQGPKDIIAVFDGYLSPSHLDLLKDNRVKSFLVEIVTDCDKSQINIEEQSKVRVHVSNWKPSYVILSSGDTAKPLAVSFDLSSPPEGWAYCFWIEECGEQQWTVVSESFKVGQFGGKYDVKVFKPHFQRVGIRLVPKDSIKPRTSQRRVESIFEEEIIIRTHACVDEISNVEDYYGTSGDSVQTAGSSSHTPEVSTQGNDAGESSFDIGTGKTYVNSPIYGEKQEVGEPEVPTVRVVYRSKHTTLKKPRETYHSHWKIDFGDGNTGVIEGCPILRVNHTFEPGTYRVRFISYDNYDQKILEKMWDIRVQDEFAKTYTFECKSLIRPKVQLTLRGPKKWVTGKPALFEAQVLYELAPEAKVLEVQFDPGQKFKVLWERAGDFTVSCAVSLKIQYSLGEEFHTVKNTYLCSVPVTVLTGGITQ